MTTTSNDPVEKNEDSQRGVTLGDLLLGIAFATPTAWVIGDLKQIGSGVLRYSIGLPLAVTVGVLIVVIEWHLGKFIWLRSREYSSGIQSTLAVAHFSIQIAGIGIASIVGHFLAVFLIKHIS